ncbi:MAG: hypothetical protein LBR16_08805 [Treponema sp.]|jgi:cell division protein FtsQ|nr:hypothetical protein [Treponema sp.]
MTEDYSYGEYRSGEYRSGEYRSVPAEAPARRTRLEKIIRWVVALAASALAFELVWLLGVHPFMPLAHIDVQGLETLEGAARGLDGDVLREDVLRLAGITERTSFATLDCEAAGRALEDYYLVYRAKAFKHYPDRAVIIVEGRSALACSLGMLEGRMVPVIFDREGVVIDFGAEDGALEEDLKGMPVVSGLVFNPPALGARIPARFHGLFEELETIRRRRPELMQALSEIRIVRKAFDGFELMLYPVSQRVRVLLGSELNEDLLKYTLMMVKAAARYGGADTLDFRTSMASYSPKEGIP